MLFPIGDEPHPPKRALANQALIALNAIIFLLVTWNFSEVAPSHRDPLLHEYLRQLGAETGQPKDVLIRATSAYELVLYQYGFRSAEPSVLTLFTSMFLHADFMHLCSNMVFLWIFGANVEAKLGRARYLLTYLVTGLAATLFYAVFQGSSHIPLVGASGAISGILGCYFLWFPYHRVRVFVWVVVVATVTRVPARIVLAFYLVVDNLLPFLRGAAGDTAGADSSVAYGAHVGGFMAGLLCVKVFDALQSPWQVTSEPRASSKDHDGIESFDEAIRFKSWETALRLFADMAPHARQDVEDQQLLVLADGLSEIERYEAALAVLKRFLVTRPRSAHLAAAHLRVGYIQLRGLRRLESAYQHFLTVLDLNPSAEVEKSARRALEEIDSELGRL